jgi:hypothetical protein
VRCGVCEAWVSWVMRVMCAAPACAPYCVQWCHAMHITVVISLLQPPPEVFQVGRNSFPRTARAHYTMHTVVLLTVWHTIPCTL